MCFSETQHVREAAVIIHIVSRLSHQFDCIMHSNDWVLSIAHQVSPLKKMHNSVVMTTCYSDGIKWFHTQGKCKNDWLCIMHPEWCARVHWECWWAHDEFPSKKTYCSVSHALLKNCLSQFLRTMCRWGSIYPNLFLCIFCRCEECFLGNKS